jgi:hypothetical protein
MDAGESGGSTNGIRVELNVVKKIHREYLGGVSLHVELGELAAAYGPDICKAGRE